MMKISIVILILVAISNGLPSLSNSLNLSFVKGTNDDDASSVIEKLSRTARVISAISLLTGLSDGTVPIDNVIAELLNLGSIDLNSLEKMDMKQVAGFVNKLKSVKVNDVAKSLEQGFIDMHTMIDEWKNVGNLKNLPDEAVYQSLKELKNIDLSGLDTIKIDTILNLLEDLPNLDNQKIAGLKKALNDLSTAVKKTKTMANYENLIKILDRVKPFAVIGHVFSLHNKLPIDVNVQQQTHFRGVAADSASLNSFSSDFGPTLEAINAVISNQFIHHPTDRTYTSGFINGFENLDELAEDVRNEFVLKSINPSTDIRAVISLIKLKEPMKELNKRWSEIANEDLYTSLKRVANLQKKLSASRKSLSEADIKGVLTWVESCKIPVPSSLDATFSDRGSKAESLKRKIDALLFIQSSTEAMNLEGLVGKLSINTDSDLVEKLKEYLLNFDSKLAILKDGAAIKDVDMELQNTGYVTNFATNTVTSKYIAYFNCLAKENNDFKEVTALSQLVYQIRDIQKSAKTFDDVKTAATALLKTSASLKSIRKIGDAIKNDQGDDMKLLEVLKDLQKSSKSFGEAVTAIDSMKKMFKKAIEFQFLIDKGFQVEREVNRLTIREQFKKDWGDMSQTQHEIFDMMNRITEWLNKITMPNDSDLTGFNEIFADLQVVNVNLYANSRLDAIELFEKNQPSAEQIKLLADFKTSLLDLSKLDLKFSRLDASVKSMPQTLKDVSEVLGKNYSPTSTMPPVTQQIPINAKFIGSTRGSSRPIQTTTSAGEAVVDNMAKIMAIGKSVVAVIGILAILICLSIVCFIATVFCSKKKWPWANKQCIWVVDIKKTLLKKKENKVEKDGKKKSERAKSKSSKNSKATSTTSSEPASKDSNDRHGRGRRSPKKKDAKKVNDANVPVIPPGPAGGDLELFGPPVNGNQPANEAPASSVDNVSARSSNGAHPQALVHGKEDGMPYTRYTPSQTTLDPLPTSYDAVDCFEKESNTNITNGNAGTSSAPAPANAPALAPAPAPAPAPAASASASASGPAPSPAQAPTQAPPP